MKAMSLISYGAFHALRPTAGNRSASQLARIYNTTRQPLCASHRLTRPLSTSASSHPRQPFSRTQSPIRRVVSAVFFTSLGIFLTGSVAMGSVGDILNPVSDEDTRTMFVPSCPAEEEVENYINNHWLAKEMRTKPGFVEMRPHMKIPPAWRKTSLTGGTLTGPGRVVVPPFAWVEEGGKGLISISYLGNELCGHPNIIHGGFLATMLDEGMARSCFGAVPYGIAMTANLTIDYRSPCPANSYVVLRATTTQVEGRKAWVEGRIETLVGEGETPVVIAEAKALFVSPKQASMMKNFFPAT